MSKLVKVFCLALLLSVCLFPASAFASSNHSSSTDKKNLLSSIFSIFSYSSSANNYNYSNYDSQNNNYDDKNKNNNWGFDFDDLFDWFDDKDDWWKDLHNWDDYKTDSFKLWEKYYCW